jgi:hypothetical protein
VERKRGAEQPWRGAALMRTIRDLGKSVVNQRDRFGLNPSSRSRIVVSAA